MKLYDMVLVSMFAAVVAVLGLIPPIALPFTPVPITAQTLGVMLAGAMLGSKRGFISLLLFVLLVGAGAPILAGGRGGLAVLFGPSGGYILSWPFASFIIGFLVEKNFEKLAFWKVLVFNIIGGILFVYLCGISYLSWIANMNWISASISALAYIPGDLTKAVISAFLAVRIQKSYPLIKARNKQAA
ncbi:biotin transporter BioY [Aeribacillus sp. FSL K6-2848]|jgi:biotin transport system substrate-specific component|uniref:Biotin transporter n=1 Tax=Aeribacillus pallidus TaxID=33936 RepID=A0A163YJJ1_9BACI|nr:MULTISPECIES: biotin transporter BioY [Aeribacillus]KZM53741.1 biotin biosynthesis protein BioY [Aeribacillus pallidus]KZN96991.1 biotin biosynthesis protein BioY [Aeribacillus pallidus]MDR9794783.1 biotin transporter BioY [Aeribacillus pallidus]MED0650356.1 biotin transporter BioY [Aeribacillus composti]MED4485507.1 biotin transporter BioY [Aeribacillus pallidus]